MDNLQQYPLTGQDGVNLTYECNLLQRKTHCALADVVHDSKHKSHKPIPNNPRRAQDVVSKNKIACLDVYIRASVGGVKTNARKYKFNYNRPICQ